MENQKPREKEENKKRDGGEGWNRSQSDRRTSQERGQEPVREGTREDRQNR